MKRINALKARSRLGTILDEVSQEGIHYVIERLREPLVVVLPFEEYSEYKYQLTIKNSANTGQELLKSISSFQKKFGGLLAKGENTTQIIRQERDKR